MYKIAVIDDDSLFLNKMSNILEKYSDFESYFYSNPLDFLDNLSTYHFSLIFLDIEMPNLTGLEVLNKLEELGYESLVIFITNNEQHMINCFNKNVISFISKSSLSDTIHSHIEKSLLYLLPKIYSFQTEFGLKKIEESTIGFIIIDLRKILLTLNNHHQIVLQYKTLADVLRTLNSDLFFQINRSTIINISKVTKYTNDNIYLFNHLSPLPLSKYRKKYFIEAYFNYSLRRKY